MAARRVTWHLVIVHCANCQAEVPPPGDRCQSCGSNDVMVGVETASGTRVSFQRDSPRVRGQIRRHGERRYSVTFQSGPGPYGAARRHVGDRWPGGARPHVRVYNDVLFNHDRGRMERRLMHTDSERDYYSQQWYSLETGECVWSKEGRLSDPDVHGQSARRRRQED